MKLRNFTFSAARRLGCAWLFASVLACSACATEIPHGKSETEILAGDHVLKVFAYKPACYRGNALLVLFHGTDRKADFVRDSAAPLADAGCAILVAPLFDKERFPRWMYQFGGVGEIIEANGERRFRLRPKEQWTGKIVLSLVDALRQLEGRSTMPYYLIGHSAGGQFLSRFAAFVQGDTRMIVIANPGSHVFPTRHQAFPYGFGGLHFASEAAIEHYLARPILLTLATRDLKREGLDKSIGAERQGQTRYERGINVYHSGRALAMAKGWRFGWSLLEVDGLGHGSGSLYRRPELADAIFGRR
jgi:hypothetical protein